MRKTIWTSIFHRRRVPREVKERMGRAEGRTSLHIGRRTINKSVCVRCAENEVRSNSVKFVEYSLRIRPNTDKWSEDGSADKASDKQNSDLPFREGVLLAIKRVDIWALEPIGTFDRDQCWSTPTKNITRSILPITIAYTRRYFRISVPSAPERGVTAGTAPPLGCRV